MRRVRTGTMGSTPGARRSVAAARAEVDCQQTSCGHVLVDISFLKQPPDSHSGSFNWARIRCAGFTSGLRQHSVPVLGDPENAHHVPTLNLPVLQLGCDGYSLRRITPCNWSSVRSLSALRSARKNAGVGPELPNERLPAMSHLGAQLLLVDGSSAERGH